MTELSGLTELAPPVALALALNGIGFGVKKSAIPDRFIPVILIALGAVVYPFIAEVGKVSFQVQNPTALNVIFGTIIGAGSTGLHQAVSQFIGGKEPPSPPAQQ